MEKVIEVKPIQTDIINKEVENSKDLHFDADQSVIKDQATYESAADILKRIKAKQKELDAMRKNITKPLDAAKKAVMDLFREPMVILDEAECIIKQASIDYTTEQDRIRQEQQDKLDRQARAAEEKKKKALEEQARKKEEEARLLREKAEKADAEEKARLEAAAKKAEEKAAEKREKKEEVVVEAPVLAQRAETPKGISYKTVYYVEIEDFAKLPDDYKLPNVSMLNKFAQAGKGKVKIPGTVIKSRKSVI